MFHECDFMSGESAIFFSKQIDDARPIGGETISRVRPPLESMQNAGVGNPEEDSRPRRLSHITPAFLKSAPAR